MTQDIRYALMFLAEVAKKPWRGPVAIRKVADRHSLSFKFLEQVVGKLRKSGILWVHRGRSGGYGLEDQPLFLADIYEALGRKMKSLACPFPSDCRGGAACAEKEIEAKLAGKFNDELAKTNLLC